LIFYITLQKIYDNTFDSMKSVLHFRSKLDSRLNPYIGKDINFSCYFILLEEDILQFILRLYTPGFCIFQKCIFQKLPHSRNLKDCVNFKFQV